MAYDMSFIDTSNTMVDLWRGMNNVLDGKFLLITFFTIGIIMFMAMSRYLPKITLTVVSAFLSLIFAFAWGLGFLSFGVLFIPLVMLFLSLLWLGLGE